MRQTLKLTAIAAFLLVLAAAVPSVAAQTSGPCGDTVTVVYGDTLIDIAERCETTVAELLDANPQIENTRAIPVGTVLNMPSADRPEDGRTYVVQRGDTLYGIASRFDTSIAALLDANPQITNPALIYAGQRITIPAQDTDGPSVQVEPDRGRPGDTVLVDADDFPAETSVVVGFGRPQSEYDVIASGRTSPTGSFDRTVTVPDFADPDDEWVFVVATENRRITEISDRFDVLPPVEEEPSVSISPQQGPVGTTVQVDATGFPANTSVMIGVGRANAEPATQEPGQTNAQGQLHTQVEIPAAAEPNEPWVVVVSAAEQRLSAISNTFRVTQEARDGQFERTNIYLIALEDAGRTGEEIGCNDSVVPVEVQIEPTVAPMTAAYEELLALDSRTYGESGLYNALHASELTVESIDIDNREAIVRLSGTIQLGGTCDVPRIEAQLRQTALQYSTVDSVSIFVNGQPLEDVI